MLLSLFNNEQATAIDVPATSKYAWYVITDTCWRGVTALVSK